MMKPVIHLVGYGSQGKAWARCLRKAGRRVVVYGRNSTPQAQAEDFESHPLTALPEQLRRDESPISVLVLSCSDEAVASVYEAVRAIDRSLLVSLLHGFAVYSGALDLLDVAPRHRLALLAPKAIGSELEREFFENHPGPHRLRLAVHFPDDAWFAAVAEELALDLGFDRARFIPATFEQETVSDLLSEQGLLCGGVFTLLDWTLEAMLRAGVPPALAKEECFKELELIARMLVEKGFASTFQGISQAAQAGTVQMRNRFEDNASKGAFEACARDILDKKFVDFFNRKDWKKGAEALGERFRKWDERLA